MPVNRAAWQEKPGVRLSIREVPYPTNLAPHEVVLKAHAWAINPADHIVQDSAEVSFIKYPLILGEDATGTVVSVGSEAIARFKPSDRVLAFTTGVTKPEMGGFQDYLIVDTRLACHIPDSMSFAETSVFPLGLGTAACALFAKGFLALPYPTIEPVHTGKSILIWGGSSSVGSNAIQLAKAAGFDVVSTSSPRNFDHVKSLGARKMFDYSSPRVIADIVVELDRSDCVGIFHAAGSVEPSLEIAGKAKADLLVASATQVPEDKVPQGVRAKMVFGADLAYEIAPAVFENFLPKALMQGRYKVAPEPMILVKKGLEGIQEGVDTLKKGVSAKKVVVVAE